MGFWSSFIIIVFLALSSRYSAVSGDRQKMISTPDKPTKVFIGDNVSLVWQYYKPAHLPLFEVVFGYWKSPGYLHPKLIAVDSKGVISVRAGYETAVGWDGNLTSSLAVFVLYNVQPADGNVDFGIQVEFGLADNPLKDVVQLLVEAKHLPRITDITTPPILRTGQNVNLSCIASGLSLLIVTWHRGRNVVSNHGNGTSSAVIRLFNITQEDWGKYTCVTQNEAGEDRRTVFLRILPASPTILNTNTKAVNSSWTLRWSAVYSEGRLVTTYTAWHRVLSMTKVVDKDMTRKDSWLRKNVSGFMYHIELAAYKRYMFAVTAWNEWGESELESSKTLIISTNFADGTNRRTKTTAKSLHTKVATGMSPTGRANKKDEERNYNVTLVSIMIPIALSSLLLGGIYCLCRKSVCRKEKEQRHQEITAITRLYFTSQDNGSSDLTMLIYTGGAKGVDTHVERLCHLYGHTCVVLIPPCHPRSKSLAPLTQSQLDAATPTVTQVAFRLGRQLHHPISLQYIQRNYHVIQPATLVLALGHFDELGKHLLGGTGWGVVMAQISGKPLYVFDVDKEQWCWWNPTSQAYQVCEGMTEEQIALPTLQDKTAIVGTREEDPVLYPTLEALFKRQ